MIGLLTAGGDLSRKKVFLSCYQKADLKIAVDSGSEYYYKYKKLPDLVLGDFDSISKDAYHYLSRNKIELKKFPPEKNATDLELGIDYLISKGCEKVQVLGGIGNRVDHSLANIFLLKKYFDQGIEIVLINDLMELEMIKGRITVYNHYQYSSILPITDKGIKLSLKGFYYPLENYYYPFGSTLGVSNYLVGDRGEIEIHEGLAILVKTNEKNRE